MCPIFRARSMTTCGRCAYGTENPELSKWPYVPTLARLALAAARRAHRARPLLYAVAPASTVGSKCRASGKPIGRSAGSVTPASR